MVGGLKKVKKTNEYTAEMGRLYAKTPKAVFAAVAWSFPNWACGTEAENSDELKRRFIEEWQALYDNGIIPQRPHKW